MPRKPTWRLLNSGANDGFTNMAIDEAVLLAVQEHDAPPTLRFYAWQPACLSIGTFQSVAEDVNVAACAASGIDWVRRPTGGRAILHDREVTYSVIARLDDERVAGDVMASYHRISRGLLLGLQLLGVQADLAPSGIPAAPSGAAQPAACFAAPSQHEIMAGGRKIIGSAQRRQGSGLLQHGSLLLDLDVDKLMAVLRFPSAPARAVVRQRVETESVTLNQLLGRPLAYSDVVPALTAGFASALDVELASGVLSPWEEETAGRLRGDKYLSDAWRYRK